MDNEMNSTIAATTTAVATFYKAPPVFTEKISYTRWINELKFWEKMTKIDAKEKGLAVALSLPVNSDIKDKSFYRNDSRRFKC